MAEATARKRKPSKELVTSVGWGGMIGQMLEPIAVAHGVPPGVVTAVATGLTHWLQGQGRAK